MVLMKRVLFVCVENSCRSQMAEAFAKMYGENALESYSAGSRPSGTVNEKAISAMNEVKYDLKSHFSKSLTQIPDVEYDYAITLGCGDECPNVIAKHKLDWKIPDPKAMNANNFAQVRELIKNNVLLLMEEIKNG